MIKKINKKNITKVICEIGINHNGSVKTCKELIKKAHESDSWGVKFQYRNLKKQSQLLSSSEEILLSDLGYYEASYDFDDLPKYAQRLKKIRSNHFLL